ncbi:MAG: MGMT family protein [Candidatus Woesearchaeota archaeon]
MGFNQCVWQICMRIPKGKVATYKQIAHILGTKSYRAVGNALNKNPYWPDVPCHRVVGSDGHLTGFARGIKKKKLLLEKEGICVKNYRVNLQKYLWRYNPKRSGSKKRVDL